MFGNMFYNILYQVTSLIISIIVTPYVSRVLGPEGIGQYTLADAYVQYFVLFGCLGLTTYGIREIAYVRDKKSDLKNTFWELFLLRVLTLSVAIMCYFFIFFILNYKENIVYKIVIITLISNIFDISWFYIGIEDFKDRAIKSTLVRIIILILILLYVKNENDVWLYAMFTCMGNLISQLVMWKGIFKKYFKNISISKKRMKRHLKISLTMFATAIVMQIYTLLDKVMLGEMSGEIAVGYYENAQRIIRAIATFLTAAMQAVTPTMSNYYITGKMNEFKYSAYFTFKLVCFIGFPMMFGVVGISDTFSEWFFGVNFKGINTLLIIGAPIIVSWGFTSILGYNILVATDNQNKLTLSVSIGAIVDIILNIFLIKKYKASATMFSTVIAELIGFFIMLLFVRTYIDIKKLFIGNFRYLFMAVIMCLGIKLVPQFVSSNGISLSFIQIVTGIIIYLSELLLLQDKFFLQVLESLKNKREIKY